MYLVYLRAACTIVADCADHDQTVLYSSMIFDLFYPISWQCAGKQYVEILMIIWDINFPWNFIYRFLAAGRLEKTSDCLTESWKGRQNCLYRKIDTVTKLSILRRLLGLNYLLCLHGYPSFHYSTLTALGVMVTDWNTYYSWLAALC